MESFGEVTHRGQIDRGSLKKGYYTHYISVWTITARVLHVAVS